MLLVRFESSRNGGLPPAPVNDRVSFDHDDEEVGEDVSWPVPDRASMAIKANKGERPRDSFHFRHDMREMFDVLISRLPSHPGRLLRAPTLPDEPLGRLRLLRVSAARGHTGEPRSQIE